MGKASALAEKVEFTISQMVEKKLDHVHTYIMEKGIDSDVSEQKDQAVVDFLSYFKDFWI
jgi:hypothetical protein